MSKLCVSIKLFPPCHLISLFLSPCLLQHNSQSVVFPTDLRWQGCHFNISLTNLEGRTLISLWPLCNSLYGPPSLPSNYASAMCCTSQEGALLSEFAPCSPALEHVKLSAHRSRWPVCPVLPVVFHSLFTCLPLWWHSSLLLIPSPSL